MILSPRSGGMVNVPPLMTVPAGAVVIEVTWQMLQPIESKREAPATAFAVAARAVSRGGTLVARMKRVKRSTSSPLGASGVAGSWMAGTPLRVLKEVTSLPFEVFSFGWRGLV